jgi:hypothetical protein
MVPHFIWRLGLKPLQVVVYVYLIRVAGIDGTCWQSTKTIAKATGVSVGTVSKARKALEATGLITVTKTGKAGRGHSYEVTIPNLWAVNIGYIDGDPQHVATVETMATKLHQVNISHKTSPGEPKTSPGEPKKNPIRRTHRGREDKNNEHSRDIQTESGQGSGPVLRKTEAPKSVSPGSGDAQRDHVDATADVSKTQAKELVARSLYQLLWPELDYPKGTSKRAKEARRSAEIAADRVLERIGRENYQDALDACHILLTRPSDAEAQWLAKVSSLYGLVDPVTKQVDRLRRKAKRQAAVTDWLDAPAEADPEITPQERIDVPAESVQIWEQAKVALKGMVAPSIYANWLAHATLHEVPDSHHLVIMVPRASVSWVQSRLAPVIANAVNGAAGRAMSVTFVNQRGVSE